MILFLININISLEYPTLFHISMESKVLIIGIVMLFNFMFSITENSIETKNMFGIGLLRAATAKIIQTGNNAVRHYSLQPMGASKVKWDPEKLSPAAKIILDDFRSQLSDNDKESAYNTMCYIINDENGVFIQGFGHVCSTVNAMIYEHNKKYPNKKIMEKEYLDTHGYKYNHKDLEFLGKSTQGTLISNIYEILSPQVLKKKIQI